MPAIEIYFSGFICHVGPSAKEGSDRTTLVRSILIADGENHNARIRTSGDAKSGYGTSVRNRGLAKCLGKKLRTDVTFAHLGAVASTCDGLFMDAVLHLDDLTRAGVTLHRDPPGLQVHLPAGIFTVVKYYDSGGTWTLDDKITKQGCVPKVTMLKASGTNATVSFNNKKFPLGAKGGWILITNLEKKPHTAAHDAIGDHWKKQHTVTTGGPSNIATYTILDMPRSSEKCKVAHGIYTDEVLKIIEEYRVSDSSECTNSHWP
ncbi:MAG TPA: hypothetical protein VN380_03050 [Thermoanaerobaculia bacterium]|nr:hypothetical protein [Thermoanaerobaculia bacterium]